MNLLKKCFSHKQFVAWFLIIALLTALIETFMLGMWRIPIIGYRIPFMSEITQFDLMFAALYALLFGFGTALWITIRSYGKIMCAIGSGSGITALFTLLCPICPVFFLTYFGLSASVMAFAPYMWWIRLFSVVILLAGIMALIKAVDARTLKTSKPTEIVNVVMVISIISLFFINQTMAIGIGMKMVGESHASMALSGDFGHDVVALVTPSEVPFYGKELGLNMSSIEAINASINQLATMAPMQGSNPIELTDEEMKRYIDIGTEPYITCEFCCGVKTLVREDGTPTCGCAHSIAMRGTVAYLIRNHPEMTNEEISFELVRQKGMYFPNQMQERMAQALAGDKTDFLPDIKYLTMRMTESELTALQKQAQSSGFKPSSQAPGMVGGC